MKKNKDAYVNFVCPYCWHTLDDCTCSIFPPYHTIFIDRNIQEHIRLLNEKGYRTMGCCEGHRKVCLNTYIAFANNYFKEQDLPSGFKYNKRKNAIIYDYSLKLTEEEMMELKREKLAVLLEWCKNLPNRKV